MLVVHALYRSHRCVTLFDWYRADHISLMNKRLRAYYSGSVQGVGFRFTAERIASSLGITGWVKNLRDGRVEILCEGADSALKDFLKKIEDIFSGYIRDKDIDWGAATGEFEIFDIRF